MVLWLNIQACFLFVCANSSFLFPLLVSLGKDKTLDNDSKSSYRNIAFMYYLLVL